MYCLVEGWFIESDGIHNNKWYGAQYTDDSPLIPIPVILEGEEAVKASKEAKEQKIVKPSKIGKNKMPKFKMKINPHHDLDNRPHSELGTQKRGDLQNEEISDPTKNDLGDIQLDDLDDLNDIDLQPEKTQSNDTKEERSPKEIAVDIAEKYKQITTKMNNLADDLTELASHRPEVQEHIDNIRQFQGNLQQLIVIADKERSNKQDEELLDLEESISTGAIASKPAKLGDKDENNSHPTKPKGWKWVKSVLQKLVKQEDMIDYGGAGELKEHNEKNLTILKENLQSLNRIYMKHIKPILHTNTPKFRISTPDFTFAPKIMLSEALLEFEEVSQHCDDVKLKIIGEDIKILAKKDDFNIKNRKALVEDNKIVLFSKQLAEQICKINKTTITEDNKKYKISLK